MTQGLEHILIGTTGIEETNIGDTAPSSGEIDSYVDSVIDGILTSKIQ